MAYRYWSLVMLVLAFPLSAQGHEACYNDSWTYHQHTHSCFHLFLIGKTWPEARDYCAGIQFGSNYGVMTRLAKIDDSQTNYFVRTLFPKPGWQCWIGLHKTDGQFRWDGYPDETPEFISSNWEDSLKPYVTISRSDDLWMGLDGSALRHFECQHGAKKIGPITCQRQPEANSLKFICMSAPSPVKAKCQWTHGYEWTSYLQWAQVNTPSYEVDTANEGGDISYTTTCSFILSNLNPGTSNVQIKMYPDIIGMDFSGNEKVYTVKWISFSVVQPQEPTFMVSNKDVNGPVVNVVHGSDDVNITCNIDTGSPAVSSTTMSCESPITNEITTQGGVTPLSFSVVIGQVREDMDGRNCTCWGEHVTGRTEISNLTLRVVNAQPTCNCSTCLSTGTIIGLILGSNIVVIVLTIIAMIACRKFRDKNKPKSNQDSARGHNNVGFHKPEPEQDSYVDVNNAVIFPSRDFQTPTRDQSKDTAFVGDELENTEDAEYQTCHDTEEERPKGDNYDILHPDDPNYNNLNGEPLRPYDTIDPGDKGAWDDYLEPKPTGNEIGL